MLNKGLRGSTAREKLIIKNEIQRIVAAIQERRTQQSITQEQLAEMLDIHVNTLKFIEQGRRIPSLPMLIKIALVLKIQISIENKTKG